MPESTSERHLAPSTPEKPKRPARGTTNAADTCTVVLESSPGRPGTSRATNTTTTTNATARLSSFYFRGAPSSQQHQQQQQPISVASTASESSEAGEQPPVSSPVAVDLDGMVISPRDAPGDFASLVAQYKWGGAAASRKRGLAEHVSSDEDDGEGRASKRATPVAVLSDESGGEQAVRGPRRGRLQRGARPSPAVSVPSSPPPPPLAAQQPPPRRTLARRPAQHSVSLDGSDSDSESDDSEAVFERRFTDIEPHVLRLFNHGTAAELMADTGASADEAQIVMDLRPFADVDAVEQAMRRTRGVRLAMFNQVRDTLLGHAEVEQVIGQCSGIFAQLKNAMRSAGVQSNEATGAVSVAPGVTLRQPQMINKEFRLKHYQLEGVAWLSCLRDAGASGILADEMGLGKTFQVIAFICKGLEEARVRAPTMVVCPSSTLDNWLNECARFAPALRVVSYYGSQPERLAQQARLDDESQYDVLVTTYNVATGNKMDRMFLKRRKFAALILDEGHMVKNCMSSRYKWLAQIRAPFRLLLTGTPLQNNLQELVSLLTFILPQVFADAQPALSHAFKARHGAKRSQTAAAPDSDEGVQTPDAAVSATEAQHINQAKTLLRPFVLRRRKCDVLGDLPTKTEHIVRLDLTPVQRTLYDSVRPDQDTDIQSRLMNLDAALQLDAAECSAKNAKDKSWISSFMDMRKVADHPLLLRSHYDDTALRKMARAILREPDYAEASYEYVLEDMEVCSDFELHKLSVTYPSLR
ncbi:DNA-dependent ATPase fun30, partial [Coemansia sp. RSA 2703]